MLSQHERHSNASSPGTGSSAMASRGAWRPLLDGTRADRAWEAIDAIANGVQQWYASASSDAALPPDRLADASLAGGRAGIAIFFDYLARARAGHADHETASGMLRAAAALMTATRGVGLHEGFAGVIWAATHLRGSSFDPATEAQLARVDLTIRDYLGRTPWQDHFDLIGGLVGLGVYALERLPRPAAAECLTRVVERLDETAERHPDGITWRTAPALLPDGQRERLPHGWYNLGVAHGLPGIIALLGEACATDVAAERARPLLRGAVDWLRAQRLPAGAGACFPHCVAPELAPHPSRLAWCFGDAGIAATLLLAARYADESSWEAEALEIAHHAAERAPGTTGVEDAGLCHGAAGLAHVFNRLFQATGKPWLADAAGAWFERTLGSHQPAYEIAGFPACEPAQPGNPNLVPDPGLLTGAAGVGLALLAAVTDTEPAWDRVLLVSIPPRRP